MEKYITFSHIFKIKQNRICRKYCIISTENFPTSDNTVVLNHFHSVKNFLFSSAKPRDFDGMLGTVLPVSMYTTKTPIEKCRFNVTQLKEFFTFSVKDRYQLNYFICIKDFNADNYFFKIKIVLFRYLLLSAS